MMFFFTGHESPINGRACLWQGTSCPYTEKSKFFSFTAAAVSVNFGMKIKDLGSCCIAPIRLGLMPEGLYARPLRRKGKDDGKQVSGCFGQNTLDI